MAIVDQYGNSITCKKFNAASDNSGVARPWMPADLGSIGDLIRESDRRTIVAVSQRCAENVGSIKGALRQIATYTVGQHWKPKCDFTDKDKAEKAQSVMTEMFCPVANFSGGDITSLMYLIVMHMLRDGDVGVMLSKYETEFPAIQLIASHQIKTGDKNVSSEGVITKGKYKGKRIKEGVILDRFMRPLAYRVWTSKDEFTEIDTYSMRLFKDDDYADALRGYPVLSHGLNDIRDALQSHDWERFNMLVRSAISMVENNETGTPAADDTNYYKNGISSSDGMNTPSTVKVMDGGQWIHFKAGSKSSLTAVTHETPGDVWSSYQDRMLKNALAGIPWPMSFVWEATGQGTAEHRDVAQARRTISDMQGTLMGLYRWIMGYAYQCLVKLGYAEANTDWWKWSATIPPVITINDGKETKANLELWRAGLLSDSEMLEAMAKNPIEFWQKKFDDWGLKMQLMAQAESKYGVKFDNRVLGMFTVNDMAQEKTTTTTKKQ